MRWPGWLPWTHLEIPMKSFRLPDWRMALAAGVTLGATLMLVACGGGGGDTAAGTPPITPAAATNYTQGAVSGFGSVIVGGVRFDDSTATVTDEDGNSKTRNDVKLGMMVEVDSGNVDRTAATALAVRIRMGSEVVGPVGTIDTAASTVKVLGQTVLVTTSTVFDSTLSGGLSALTAGAVIEVHGILDPANARIVATRIEPKAGATAFKLRGAIANLDTTAKTFKINGELVSYAGLPSGNVPPGLTNGQIVRVLVQTTQVSGAWVATALRGGLRLPDVARGEAHVEGVITVFTSTASFEINGLKIDASKAAFPDGSTGVVMGARVEVEGAIVGGVLVATKVEIEERRDHGRRELELHGDMSNLNATEKTFALRGVTVWFGGTVEYSNGTEATLANGKRVEVKGVLSTDRTRLEAQRIRFE
jgi:hypothetical protein